MVDRLVPGSRHGADPDGERDRRAAAPRLLPPPRVGQLIGPAPPATRGTGAAGAARPWRRGLALGALAAAAVGVFVLLPRWVAREALQGGTASDGGVASLAAPDPPAPDPVADAALGLREDSPGSPGGAGPGIAAPTEPEAPRGPTFRPLSPAEDAGPASMPKSRPARSTHAAPHRQGDGGHVAAKATDEAPWTAAVSDGLLALDRRDFDGARSAFARAEAARPGTAAVADGLARADEGLRAEALARHREAAEAAEGREEWRAAVAEYDAALRLDPAVAFALAGRGRAVLRAELDERLEGYLARPDRLAAAAVAREAGAALERAREVERPGTRLAGQVAALDGLLAESRTPVAVRLVSDGKTEVVVLRHGPLGSFRERSVDLLPGTYAVVGRRRGYRDVRRTLVVPRGRSPEPLVVRCEETL